MCLSPAVGYQITGKEVSTNSSYNHAKIHGVDTCTDPGSDSTTYGMIGCISLGKLGVFLYFPLFGLPAAGCVWGHGHSTPTLMENTVQTDTVQV